MGAPVVAYCRLDEREIRSCEPVVTPDCLIVLDPTLVHQVDLFAGLGPDGYVLVNSTRTLDQARAGDPGGAVPRERLLTVPATEVALRQIGRPLPNAALLGELRRPHGGGHHRRRGLGHPGAVQPCPVGGRVQRRGPAAELFRLGRQVMTASGRAVLGAPAD